MNECCDGRGGREEDEVRGRRGLYIPRGPSGSFLVVEQSLAFFPRGGETVEQLRSRWRCSGGKKLATTEVARRWRKSSVLRRRQVLRLDPSIEEAAYCELSSMEGTLSRSCCHSVCESSVRLYSESILHEPVVPPLCHRMSVLEIIMGKQRKREKETQYASLRSTPQVSICVSLYLGTSGIPGISQFFPGLPHAARKKKERSRNAAQRQPVAAAHRPGSCALVRSLGLWLLLLQRVGL